MVNLNDIDESLRFWADYVARRQDGGLGYAMQSLYRLIESGENAVAGNVAFLGMPVDVRDPADQEKIDLVERIVMREIDERSRQVILAWYLGRGTIDQRARDLGTTRRTLYRWVESAKLLVARKLIEIRRGIRQAGIPMRVYGVAPAANDCA